MWFFGSHAMPDEALRFDLLLVRGQGGVHRLRDRTGFTRKSAVVDTLGSTFIRGEGIHTGPLVQVAGESFG